MSPPTHNYKYRLKSIDYMWSEHLFHEWSNCSFAKHIYNQIGFQDLAVKSIQRKKCENDIAEHSLTIFEPGCVLANKTQHDLLKLLFICIGSTIIVPSKAQITHRHNNNWDQMHNIPYRISDCCLMPTQQLFKYIMARTS